MDLYSPSHCFPLATRVATDRAALRAARTSSPIIYEAVKGVSIKSSRGNNARRETLPNRDPMSVLSTRVGHPAEKIRDVSCIPRTYQYVGADPRASRCHPSPPKARSYTWSIFASIFAARIARKCSSWQLAAARRLQGHTGVPPERLMFVEVRSLGRIKPCKLQTRAVGGGGNK